MNHVNTYCLEEWRILCNREENVGTSLFSGPHNPLGSHAVLEGILMEGRVLVEGMGPAFSRLMEMLWEQS